MRISPLPNTRYGLYIDTELLNSFPAPELAAEAVYGCCTGYLLWDNNGPYYSPADLNDWIYIDD